jgi:microcystin degradation protein MlrC
MEAAFAAGELVDLTPALAVKLGAKVAVEGTIVFARPVRYQRRSNYMTGQVVDLGLVAVIACGGLRIMLTERRSMPFDRDHLSAAGISLEECRALVVKSAIAWKAGFAELAARHLFVDTPGICASNLTRFHYTRGAAELFPLNRYRSWSAETCTEH